MPKPELQEFARKAAVESAPVNGVGAFVELIEEGESVFTYLFETKQKGYVGWRWSVTVFDSVDGPTVSEVLLMPGEQSLVAPQWVPWSERLADWKALQAELERQAAEEAALAAEEDGDDDSEDDEAEEDFDDDSVEDETETEDAEGNADSGEVSDSEGDDEAELAATDLEPGEDAEADSGKARKRIPRFMRRRRTRKN
ncbi:MAG: hypothetical protein RL605_677 [Actinomycetota bacterium]|jgi:hypothetical protein